MGQKFSDAARSELSVGITATDTTMSLLAGATFPSANTGAAAVGDAADWFKAVIQDATNIEIVYVRSHDLVTSPNTISNVLRGQDGTTAQTFASGSVVGLRWVAADAAKALAGGVVPVTTMTTAYTSGRITSVTEDGVTTTIGYDGSGRVSTVSYPHSGLTRTETYTYNSDGSMAGMTATEA